MKELVKEIESLKQRNIKNLVNKRINEFKKINKDSNDELFNEMCFCILTANYNAEKTIKIQNEIGKNFCNGSRELLCSKLKDYGKQGIS